LEGGSWKGCENVRNKVVVYSYEQRRMDETFKGGQDPYRAVEPMMMMMRSLILFTFNRSHILQASNAFRSITLSSKLHALVSMVTPPKFIQFMLFFLYSKLHSLVSIVMSAKVGN
jgi:hypothetical protein